MYSFIIRALIISFSLCVIKSNLCSRLVLDWLFLLPFSYTYILAHFLQNLVVGRLCISRSSFRSVKFSAAIILSSDCALLMGYGAIYDSSSSENLLCTFYWAKYLYPIV